MTASASHPGLSSGRWFALSLPEQMGNVGSEYERALSWKKKNDPERMQKAFDRMLELLDLTLADPRWKHRLKEMARLRDEACRLLEAEPADPGLSKYFFQFSLLARRNK
jgi:hypothetical protein